MNVNPRDGRCRECGGILTIVEADDASMTVECDAGHCYPVEHDAFGDGCMTYIFGFLAKRLEGAGEI